MEPLFKAASKCVRRELTFKKQLMKYRNGDCGLRLESNENLCDFFPMLRAAWADMRVDTFNTSIFVDRKTGELKWWGNLDYSYAHLDGGTNGARILSFDYSKSEGWKIMTEAKRKKINDREREKQRAEYEKKRLQEQAQ